MLCAQEGSADNLQLERGTEQEQRADFIAERLGCKPASPLTDLCLHRSCPLNRHRAVMASEAACRHARTLGPLFALAANSHRTLAALPCMCKGSCRWHSVGHPVMGVLSEAFCRGGPATQQQASCWRLNAMGRSSNMAPVREHGACSLLRLCCMRALASLPRCSGRVYAGVGFPVASYLPHAQCTSRCPFL